MRSDQRGLALSTDSDAAEAAFDAAIESYVKYRTDAMAQVERVLAADPGFALAHCLKGYLTMLSSHHDSLPAAASRNAASRNAD